MLADENGPQHSSASGPARYTDHGGRSWPVLQGLLPLQWHRFPADFLAGVTLAALGIPEVLGYAKIAGMPVVTGLYTILLPMALFALLGSSRHLVVGADSATAAILAAGLIGMAAVGSPIYAALAGLAALLTGAMLLLARLIRLGFLANFLSRTVLIGFLTGVGVQVAVGQLPEMIGIRDGGQGTVGKVHDLVTRLHTVNGPTVLVSAAVIVLVVGIRLLTRRIPGALLAVVAAIIVSRLADLPQHGVAALGAVPQGLPHLTLPAIDATAALALLGTSVSMFVVILAQSSATSRAYAARYEEDFDENADLVGLGVANIGAAFTGTFVVNGSPTKTEMVDGAGGRSQLAQLTTVVVVLVVLLYLTGPLAHLPLAVLATIVFLIGVELIDVHNLRGILRVRRAEFVVALLTTLAVIFIGVQYAIVFAVLASIVDHLRYSYDPRSTVLVPAEHGEWTSLPASRGERTATSLVIYRFGSSLYYANAHQLLADVTAFLRDGHPLTVFCLDAVAIGDIDYTAAAVLRRVHHQLAARGARLVMSEVAPPVRAELNRYGITQLIGADAFYPSPKDVVRDTRDTS
ncbi:MAG: SulP family inorganic anion transporter [Intrasporangium sp.]|uniref:SulP family inorganic anion transporter n=1 Tax=Intrasporangium sp. TaxID=1925024 RepID=UPI003F7F7359